MKFLFFLFIVTFFSVTAYLFTRRYGSKTLSATVIFLLFALFGHFIPLSESNEILLDRILNNLTPATLFLYLLDLDPKQLQKSGIGCSCTMGGKRYWLVVLLAFIASLTAQVLSEIFLSTHPLMGASLFAALLGTTASFTPLKRICGTEDVATTMLYLLAASAGLRIF